MVALRLLAAVILIGAGGTHPRGLYCYDMAGKLLWTKDFGVQMRMRLSFGEGAAIALHGTRLVAIFDHEGDGLLAAIDRETGKELWTGEIWCT